MKNFNHSRYSCYCYSFNLRCDIWGFSPSNTRLFYQIACQRGARSKPSQKIVFNCFCFSEVFQFFAGYFRVSLVFFYRFLLICLGFRKFCDVKSIVMALQTRINVWNQCLLSLLFTNEPRWTIYISSFSLPATIKVSLLEPLVNCWRDRPSLSFSLR